jgi:hypothetical protein
MRTTVTLDRDVEAMLRAAMRGRGLCFKEAVNAAIRAGLGTQNRKAAKKFRQKTFRMGCDPRAPLDKALLLAATLED